MDTNRIMARIEDICVSHKTTYDEVLKPANHTKLKAAKLAIMRELREDFRLTWREIGSLLGYLDGSGPHQAYKVWKGGAKWK